jgi:hypothetical protein
VFDEGRWEVVVCLVDIGGIVGHHCLISLFILVINISYILNDIYSKLVYEYSHIDTLFDLTIFQGVIALLS